MITARLLPALALAGVAAPAFAQPAFFADIDPGVVAYDPFLIEATPGSPLRGEGEYTPGSDIRTQGAAAFGWAGTAGVDGFGIAHSGTTSNYQPNDLGEDSAFVDFEQGGRMQWLGVANSPFDRNVTRQLSTDALAVASSEWYFGIQVNRLGWADPGDFPTDGVDNTYAVGGFGIGGGTSGLYIGYDDQAGDGLPDLVLRTEATGDDNSPLTASNLLVADTASSDNYYVLTRLTINESGNDTIEVFVDQDPTALGAADATFTGLNISDSLSPFTESRYQAPGQSGSIFFDEVLLTTTLAAQAAPIAVVVGFDSDFNGDGNVDLLDFDILAGAFGGPGDPTSGDANGDGVVDLLDFDILAGEFGSTSPSAVPEPASLALLGLGGAALLRRRRA
ncbi:MAG: dockerin type I domain-containing protein [Planctomycetota bacterium]